ncbi:hypothetical protein B5X24_HaOG214267 [Helicoverpa armigera]|nr:hypothetical protein B5X24_HaOG214267 [Helicoverpa armigera]
MNIYFFEKCDAKCDQYYLIVKESSCPRENLRPQKIRDIDWDEITYPCNSTDPEVIPFNKECVLEVEYHDTSLGCTKHVKKTNYQTHTTIPDERITITDRYKNIRLLTTTSMTPRADEIETAHKNETTNEEIDKSLYDVNVIYINDMENDMNTSHSIAETNNTHGEVNCDYAETICGDLNNHVNTTDNKITKEEKKVHVNSVRNCTTSKDGCKTNKNNANDKRNCTASDVDCKLNNTRYKDNARKEVIDNKEVKKEVRNYAEVKPDYSKGTFNRRTDIVNGAMKSKNSEEYNEVEKILLIGLSSLAGVSMVVVLALKFRRKSEPSDESDSPPTSAARQNVVQMDETAF